MTTITDKMRRKGRRRFIETYVKGSRWSTWTEAISFVLLILILLFRPAGLLGKLQPEKV